MKTRGEVAVALAMRSVFHEFAPDYALDNFQTMQEAVDHSNFSSRMGLYLTGVFAGMAVLMVIAGLYGVLAQLVSYRRREFGIRLALGATPHGILGMVLRQGLVFIGAGLARDCGSGADDRSSRGINGVLPPTLIAVMVSRMSREVVGTVRLLSKGARELQMLEPCWLFTHLQWHEMLSAELPGSRSFGPRYVDQLCELLFVRGTPLFKKRRFRRIFW